jgi:hypothetical protein
LHRFRPINQRSADIIATAHARKAPMSERKVLLAGAAGLAERVRLERGGDSSAEPSFSALNGL